MEETIKLAIMQYIQDMLAFQPDYEYSCYELGYLPKSAYQRIYGGLHNTAWMEEYLKKNNVDTSNFKVWYDIFTKVRDDINLINEVGIDNV